jgi:hypothetical protein
LFSALAALAITLTIGVATDTQIAMRMIVTPVIAATLIAPPASYFALRLLSKLMAAEDRNVQLLQEIRKLSELLPICSHCREIRDEDGHWITLEKHLAQRAGTAFSHGVCPTCLEAHYPEYTRD